MNTLSTVLNTATAITLSLLVTSLWAREHHDTRPDPGSRTRTVYYMGDHDEDAAKKHKLKTVYIKTVGVTTAARKDAKTAQSRFNFVSTSVNKGTTTLEAFRLDNATRIEKHLSASTALRRLESQTQTLRKQTALLQDLGMDAGAGFSSELAVFLSDINFDREEIEQEWECPRFAERADRCVNLQALLNIFFEEQKLLAELGFTLRDASTSVPGAIFIALSTNDSDIEALVERLVSAAQNRDERAAAQLQQIELLSSVIQELNDLEVKLQLVQNDLAIARTNLIAAESTLAKSEKAQQAAAETYAQFKVRQVRKSRTEYY